MDQHGYRPKNPSSLGIRRFCLSAVGVALLAYVYLQIPTAVSADLLALWMAGHVYSMGNPELVYPPVNHLFTMLPSEGWFPILQELGVSGYVFPYLYPPLWAALAAPLTMTADFTAFQAAAAVLNPFLLTGCVVAAWRLAGSGWALGPFVIVGMAVLLTSSVGSVALYQNQPQILVAFLTLWAIERTEKGHPATGGLLLALAAAIKIYPVLYVVFWIAGRQYRAAFVFLLAGAFLGGLSVYLCGWPLHAQFLELLGSISRTAMLTNYSYIWESVVGALIYPEAIQSVIPHPVNPGDPALVGWHILSKSPSLTIVFHVAQLVAIASFAVAFRHSSGSQTRALLWASAFATLSLLGPMSWSYHYISVVAFAPCILHGYGWRRGGLMLVGFVLLTTPHVRLILPTGSYPTQELSQLLQFIGTLAVSLLAYALFRLRKTAVAVHTSTG